MGRNQCTECLEHRGFIMDKAGNGGKGQCGCDPSKQFYQWEISCLCNQGFWTTSRNPVTFCQPCGFECEWCDHGYGGLNCVGCKREESWITKEECGDGRDLGIKEY